MSHPFTRMGSLWSLVSVTSMPVTIKPYTLLLSLSRYTLAIMACSSALSCNLSVYLHVQGGARLYIKLVVDQGACLKKKIVVKYVFWLSEDAIVNIQQLFKDKIQLKLHTWRTPTLRTGTGARPSTSPVISTS